MKIIVHPILDPQREIDVTDRLVSAIADELWRRCGGNDKLNWAEAEWHLQRIIAQAGNEARDTAVVRVKPSISVETLNGEASPAQGERRVAASTRPSDTQRGVRTSGKRRPRTPSASPRARTPEMTGAVLVHA